MSFLVSLINFFFDFCLTVFSVYFKNMLFLLSSFGSNGYFSHLVAHFTSNYWNIMANSNVYGLSIQLFEFFVLFTYMTFCIIYFLDYTIHKFNSRSNPHVYKINLLTAGALDIIMVFFPTLMILIFLLTALGYLLSVVFERGIWNGDYNHVYTLTAHQWYWSVGYFLDNSNFLTNLFYGEPSGVVKYSINMDTPKVLGGLHSVFVSNAVFLPCGVDNVFFLNSTDVIHSLGIPELAFKMDAIPGRTSQFTLRSELPGVVRGACYELCGTGHSHMPIEFYFIEEDLIDVFLFLKL